MVALDAWALIAYLRGEPASARVVALVGRDRAVASWVNLGEVLYQEARRIGFERAETSVRALAGTLRAEQPDAEAVIAAARWKQRGGISYADAFALATAQRHRVALLTGDPELLALAGEDVRMIDVRA